MRCLALEFGWSMGLFLFCICHSAYGWKSKLHPEKSHVCDTIWYAADSIISIILNWPCTKEVIQGYDEGPA